MVGKAAAKEPDRSTTRILSPFGFVNSCHIKSYSRLKTDIFKSKSKFSNLEFSLYSK